MSDRYTLHLGDCLDVMGGMADNSVDAVVSDPPYGLSFMGKNWDKGVPGEAFWVEALRVAKPGAHLLAFGGTRTFHRLAVAIEDAGWQIRDTIGWMYATGFPKSANVSKMIDKAAGAEREVVGSASKTPKYGANGLRPNVAVAGGLYKGDFDITAPATPEAAQWAGWGTALKPAWEPIIVARKPLVGTVAQNVLAYGTGGINVDGCRVGDTVETWPKTASYGRHDTGAPVKIHAQPTGPTPNSRWPANLIHDGSEEVVGLFPESVGNKGIHGTMQGGWQGNQLGGGGKGQLRDYDFDGYGDSGSAARFFYCAKADKGDRDEGLDGFEEVRTGAMQATADGSMLTGSGNERITARANHHPTVKPTELMRYLCRLVTPPNGIVLDPFMGSGSTGKGAILEGFRFVGIDITPEYVAIAEARLKHAETVRGNITGESIKATVKERERGQISLFEAASLR